MNSNVIFSELQSVIEARMTSDASTSYVAKLHGQGVDAILKKVAEEAGEVVIAGKNQDSDALCREVADLWFHCMVLLAHKGLSVKNVQDELAARFGRSGIEEKNNRKVT